MATSLTINEALDSSFRVVWKETKCASGYIVNIRNSSYEKNFTIKSDTQLSVFKDLLQKSSYFVKIAVFNDFGLSEFSTEKPTSKFVGMMSHVMRRNKTICHQGFNAF